MNVFRTATKSDCGDDWLICFGTNADGSTWYVTTDHVHGSDLHEVSGGAKVDAELVARLLNEHFEKAEE